MITMVPAMTPLVATLVLLAFACVALGEVFDYTEWKHGKPPRWGLRWSFLGVLTALPILTAATLLAYLRMAAWVAAHPGRRRPGAEVQPRLFSVPAS